MQTRRMEVRFRSGTAPDAGEGRLVVMPNLGNLNIMAAAN